MSDGELEEVRDFWNCIAGDWRIQVGDDGDSNRILNSDPVLWKFAGDVSGLVDHHRPGPEFLRAGPSIRYRRSAVHARRLRRIDVEIVRVHHPHAVKLPFGFGR